MNGSGCKTCPAKDECRAQLYRGEMCKDNRKKHGLGDPFTRGDRIRAMSDEELAKILALLTEHDLCLNPSATSCDDCLLSSFCSGCTEGDELYWLQQPAEEV